MFSLDDRIRYYMVQARRYWESKGYSNPLTIIQFELYCAYFDIEL